MEVPVDNGRTAFVVFLFGDPHLLEGGEGSKDRSTDPDRVFTLRRSNDFNLSSAFALQPMDYFHGGWSKRGDLLLHPVCDTGVHGGSTGL
jgi:hypothetical protein